MQELDKEKPQIHHPNDVNRGNQLNPDHEEYHRSREENDN